MKFRFPFLVAVFLFCLVTAFTAQAQRGSSSPKFRSSYKRKFKPSWSIFASPGFVIMNSENAGHKDPRDIYGIFKNNGMGPTLGVGSVYQFSPSFGVELKGSYLNFNGKEDANNGSNPASDVTFSTNAAEISSSLIYNVISTNIGGRYSRSRNLRLLVPYVKAGVGVLAYKATSKNEQLGLEFSEATEYPNLTLMIPFGGGVKIQYSRQLTFAPEINVNFTSTDFLDNTSYGYVSPLTGSDDAYLSASIKVMYNITYHKRNPFKIRRR